MTDPFTLATGAVAAADTLRNWYERAQAAAKTQEQKDAAALVYFAAQLASAVASLDLEFRTLLNQINKLDDGWSEEQRNELADKVQDLATRETRVDELETSTAFLRERTQQDLGWRERILHRGGPDAKLDEALEALLAAGNEVRHVVGVGFRAGTPYGVDVLEWQIRQPGYVEMPKRQAQETLGVIDRLTARSIPQAFGRFASVISRKHGISTPDWASLQ